MELLDKLSASVVTIDKKHMIVSMSDNKTKAFPRRDYLQFFRFYLKGDFIEYFKRK